MLKTIRILSVFAITVLIFSPRMSYAWDHGHEYVHRHSFHLHCNPDLTLVSGMDTIDSKVLIASADTDQN
jgi:hypothetical protein